MFLSYMVQFRSTQWGSLIKNSAVIQTLTAVLSRTIITALPRATEPQYKRPHRNHAS